MARWRRLLIGTTVWVIAYLAFYLILIQQQGESSPAWGYVVLLLVPIGLLGLVVAGRLGQRGLLAGIGVLGFATVVALPSIGVFLLPALVAAVTAAFMSDAPTRQRSTAGQ
jgi:hypothetical protein